MMDRPHDLDPDLIERSLSAKRIGRRILVRQVVGSTMDSLGALAHAGEPEGTVLIADRQMSGRGRMGRSWLAPPGTSLLVSILFRPTSAVERTGQVMMAVALGLLEPLDQLLPEPHRASLKWPNDVLTGELKIAGLIAEGRMNADGNNAVVVGLGLNVSQSADVLPPGATSLVALGVDAPSRQQLCIALLEAVDRHYDEFLSGTDLVEPWAGRLDTLGRRVTATGGGVEVTGTAVGVAADGGLQIEIASGELVVVHAGDVTLDTATT